MQAMPRVRGVANGRIVSAGATLVFGAGLALYQLTSLVLGPASSRQIDLSLSIPGIELQDLSDSNASTIKFVIGTRATPFAPVSRTTRAAASARAASEATPTPSSRPLPTVAPSPRSHPAGKKLPVDN
jgi:hypothetical protein